MTDKNEALRLADKLSLLKFSVVGAENALAMEEAAAELRRLHAANVDCMAWYEATKSERDALLEALKKIEAIEDKMFGSDWEEIEEARDIARAAIKAAEENQ